MKNFIPFLCLLLCSCNQHENIPEAQPAAIIEMPVMQEKNSDKLLPPPPHEEKPKQSEDSAKRIDTISKKIIKNGEMTVQVGNINKAQDQVNDILKENKAYVQAEQFINSDSRESVDLTIRVPHKNFDALINSFSNGVGSVVSKNISSDDVTEEYTNVSIKLANKKIYLEKYRNMLKSASSTKDMLEIQEKIRGLEDEIDVAEGKLRFIDDRVNYSTLNLALYKEKIRSSETSKIGFGNRFGDSLTQGWNSFISFILAIISFWPFFLAIPLIIVLWRKWKVKRKK